MMKVPGYYWALVRDEQGDPNPEPEVVELTPECMILRAGSEVPYELQDCMYIGDEPLPPPALYHFTARMPPFTKTV